MRAETKQHSTAVKKFKQALETGKLDPAGETVAHVTIGKVYAMSRKNEEALAAANAAIEAAQSAGTQTLSDPLQLRGLLRRNTGDLDGALTDYRALTQLHPDMSQFAQVVADIELEITQTKQ